MLITYITTIVVWMIILIGTAYIFEDRIRENGWLKDVKQTDKNPWLLVFFMSAIPLLRVVFFISEIMMVAATKEDIDELVEDLKDEFE
jgi:hypothetical protein